MRKNRCPHCLRADSMYPSVIRYSRALRGETHVEFFYCNTEIFTEMLFTRLKLRTFLRIS